MAEKRKDSNGRILRTGESQRPNGTYMYRYTTPGGKKKWCYAPTLKELREKEKEISSALLDGIDTDAPYKTVLELVDCYLKSHTAIRRQTALRLKYMRNSLSNEAFSQREFTNVKQSDAKAFFVHLHDKGLSYGTVHCYQSILKPAFEMAIQDNYLRANPFAFKISSVINYDAKARYALTQEQVDSLLEFVKSDETWAKHYDTIVILLETGLRISEIFGLTIDSVDLEHRQIHITQQLIRANGGNVYIEVPKTKCGARTIPLSDDAYEAFKRVLTRRLTQTCTKAIDGRTDFLFLGRFGAPLVSCQFRDSLALIVRRYNECHDTPLPKITPHILRHTFVSKLYDSGLDLKCLQMIAGHSKVQTTLDIYTHVDYDRVEEEFHKVTAKKE